MIIKKKIGDKNFFEIVSERENTLKFDVLYVDTNCEIEIDFC